MCNPARMIARTFVGVTYGAHDPNASRTFVSKVTQRMDQLQKQRGEFLNDKVFSLIWFLFPDLGFQAHKIEAGSKDKVKNI